MNKIDTLVIARQAFSEISKRFYSLNIIKEDDIPTEIKISFLIPIQAGLKHEVRLCLLNDDELHCIVGNYGLEYFPCTDIKKVEQYIDAVCGFLSGKYRILEHYQGKQFIKTELQSPDGNQWHTIGTWEFFSFYLPFPWGKTYKEIRNI